MELNFNFDNEKFAVVTIDGSLNAENAEDLKNEFFKHVKKTKNFIFDLKGMDFVDSTGLGAMVACLKYSVENDGEVKIANLQKKPKLLFEITRVYKIFDIYDTVEAAMGS